MAGPPQNFFESDLISWFTHNLVCSSTTKQKYKLCIHSLSKSKSRWPWYLQSSFGLSKDQLFGFQWFIYAVTGTVLFNTLFYSRHISHVLRLTEPRHLKWYWAVRQFWCYDQKVYSSSDLSMNRADTVCFHFSHCCCLHWLEVFRLQIFFFLHLQVELQEYVLGCELCFSIVAGVDKGWKWKCKMDANGSPVSRYGHLHTIFSVWHGYTDMESLIWA